MRTLSSLFLLFALFGLAYAVEPAKEPAAAVKEAPKDAGKAAITDAAKDAPKGPKFEEDIVKFEQHDKEHPVAPGGIVFVGSSSIRKWDLKKSFPNLDAINRGFGGSEIADSVRYAKRIVTNYKPRLIIFYAGDNDIAAKKTPEQVRDDYVAFVKAVREDLPNSPIVYISIKPSVKRWSLIDKIRKANSLIQDEIAKQDNVKYIDVHPPMLGTDNKPKPELFVEDGLHMTEAGYKIWNALVEPEIKASSKQSSQ